MFVKNVSPPNYGAKFSLVTTLVGLLLELEFYRKAESENVTPCHATQFKDALHLFSTWWLGWILGPRLRSMEAHAPQKSPSWMEDVVYSSVGEVVSRQEAAR